MTDSSHDSHDSLNGQTSTSPNLQNLQDLQDLQDIQDLQDLKDVGTNIESRSERFQFPTTSVLAYKIRSEAGVRRSCLSADQSFRRIAFCRRSFKNVRINRCPKTATEVKYIKKALFANEFLQQLLRMADVDKFVDIFEFREVPANTVIIQQGNLGEDLFIAIGGTFEVYVDAEYVSSFNDYRVFGELAFIYKNPRLATITAKTDCTFWTAQALAFQQILVELSIQEEKAKVSFLKNVPFAKMLNEPKLNKLANLLNTEFFMANTIITKEGDKTDKFYIVKAGTVTVSKASVGIVAQLGKGEYFGEGELLESATREITVVANAPGADLLYISRLEFFNHLGDIKKFLVPNEEARSVSKRSFVVEETDAAYANILYEDLIHIGCLGEGSFGKVFLVHHKKDKTNVFVIKKIKKANYTSSLYREHIANEKTIQQCCRNAFIIRLYRTYQDAKYVYFLMESCLGGDIFTLISREKFSGLPEESAKFVSACILEALEYLHDRNYIYRNLKPENAIFDKKGYIKITDFGFAKYVIDGSKSYTHVGTVEYVAPEIILDRGHGKAVDCWALGIFVYELLVGRTPFRRENDLSTYNAILTGIDMASFPSMMSLYAEILIKQLCRQHANQRLGCKWKGINEIRQQRWYEDFNFAKLRSRKLKSPFKIKLKNKRDMQHFSTTRNESDLEPPDAEMWNGF